MPGREQDPFGVYGYPQLEDHEDTTGGGGTHIVIPIPEGQEPVGADDAYNEVIIGEETQTTDEWGKDLTGY